MADYIQCEMLMEIPIRCPAFVSVIVREIGTLNSWGFCIECAQKFKAEQGERAELFLFETRGI